MTSALKRGVPVRQNLEQSVRGFDIQVHQRPTKSLSDKENQGNQPVAPLKWDTRVCHRAGMQAVAGYSHLYLRGGTYWFRRRVPTHLSGPQALTPMGGDRAPLPTYRGSYG